MSIYILKYDAAGLRGLSIVTRIIIYLIPSLKKDKNMNKVMFATFVVALCLGIVIYNHQESNADDDNKSALSSDERVVATAYASCGSNSASATLSISYADGKVKQDGDSYTGSGYCIAKAGWLTKRDPDGEGEKPFWLTAEEKSFLWWTWISVDTQEVSASRFLQIDRNGRMSVDTSAVASGTFENQSIYDECSTSS